MLKCWFVSDLFYVDMHEASQTSTSGWGLSRFSKKKSFIPNPTSLLHPTILTIAVSRPPGSGPLPGCYVVISAEAAATQSVRPGTEWWSRWSEAVMVVPGKRREWEEEERECTWAKHKRLWHRNV